MWRASLVDTENTTSTPSLASVTTCRSPVRAQLLEQTNKTRAGVRTSVGCEAGSDPSGSARTPRLGGVGGAFSRLGGVGGAFLGDSNLALSFFLPKPHFIFFFDFCSSLASSFLLAATGAFSCTAETVNGRARGKYST